jgi:Protein of unknown function (DUF2911)
MKRLILVAGFLVVVLLAGVVFWWYNTKSYSPENALTFRDGDLSIVVSYNRPYKKGRVIFGGLVPFGKTWRTGANEATVFETNQDIYVYGKKLARGKYSLWTVPGEQQWQVIFNATIPPWGIDVMNNGEAARDPRGDVLVIIVPPLTSPKEIEQFTITIEKINDSLELVLLWDKTLVAVPVSVSAQ